ncbi:MAG: DUF4055 domain-containing protein [Plesiomonas shigelloides]
MNVDYKHQLYVEYLPRWTECSDVVAGPFVMSEKASQYLCSLADGDDGDWAKRRNARYQKLARFSGFSGATVMGFIGLAFYRYPAVSAPDYLQLDADGSGVSLEQQAKGALSDVLVKGRIGLWVDYPLNAGSMSRAEQEERKVRPVILTRIAEHIINWRDDSLIVIREQYIQEDDGFEAKYANQWRCLWLIGGVYSVEVYRKQENGGFELIADLSGTPTDASGNQWQEIPFTFIGPENNSAKPNVPAIEEITHLNIGHFRNSADCEISSFEMRPTVAVKMTENWFTKVLRGVISMGGVIALDVDGDVKIVQPNPNDQALTLKNDKKADMIALCAKIIEPQRTQRTATEATGDQIQFTSRLSAACDNLSTAYTKALNWCARYSGDAEDRVYQLDTNFSTNKMTAQERQQLMAEWLGGAISDFDYHRIMQSDGLITQSMDEWQVSKEIGKGAVE